LIKRGQRPILSGFLDGKRGRVSKLAKVLDLKYRIE
jgi:hypothetical protein